MPTEPNSAMWTVTVPTPEPDLVFAASRFGQLYRSRDGGQTWQKLWRELSEISAIAWVPKTLPMVPSPAVGYKLA